MKRKILSVFFALALIVSMISVVSFAVEWETPKLSIEASYNNEQVKASIKIGPHTDLAALNFTLNYDSSKLSISGTPSGMDFFASAIVGTTSAGKITPTWQNINGASSKTEKEIFSVTFDVISGQSGDVQFTIENVSMTDKSGDNEVMEAGTGSILSAKVTIPAPTVAVTGINLNKTTLALTEGNSETLIATVTPENATDKTVTWTSSKPSVATVENGKVTAVAAGNAIITAKAGSFTATCDVTVTAAPCTHPNKTEVAEKASTCAEKGWDAYKKCNDCGQLFNASGNEISEIPYRALSTTHTGGTATCTTRAVCSVCNQPYGDYAAHQYTKQAKTADTLKSAGTCRDKAVYWYSCAVCDKVEKNDIHTFEGDKDANNHVGETTLVNVKDSVHNTQTPGYTGDTKCLGCNAIIASGTSIPADQHVAGDEWTFNGESHWKTCKVEGCDAIIESTKSSHTPSAWVNVGDGHHHQTCTVCERELTHEVCTFGQPLKYNATSHWEECTKCGNKQNEAAHEFLPDSDKCTGCDYTKSSTITIITPTQPGDSKPAEGNPSTGAVSSPVGYVFVGLAVVGALCLGAKKLTKKHED